jgi:hypothetical protein
MKAYSVYLNGKYIDRVFFDDDIKKEDVRKSLINHDGYSPDINLRQKHYGKTKK